MLSWDDLRYFLAVARHGSLSAAAFELGVARTTVGRRLAVLESDLGVRLMNRTPDGYVLTLAGEEVRDKAELVEGETQSLVRSVGNRDDDLSGTVRITCADSVASHLIAPCLPSLHVRYPGIGVVLTPNPRHVSLSMREADISVQLGAPDQQDVVGRRVADMAFAAYASIGYLEAHGIPRFDDLCRGHVRISQIGDMQDGAQAEWFADLTAKATAAVQTCSQEAAFGVVAADGGIACLAVHRAELDQRLVRLTTPDLPPDAAVWLVMHKDNRRTPRMKAVADHIAQHAKTSLAGRVVVVSN